MKEKKTTSEVFQLLIIFGVCVVGELLHELIPIPISAGVYGMIILFILLCTNVVKLSQVEKTGDFLASKMLVMFIPASVGLINVLPELKAMAIPVILAISVVTIIVMVVTGHVVQLVSKLTAKNKKEREEDQNV